MPKCKDETEELVSRFSSTAKISNMATRACACATASPSRSRIFRTDAAGALFPYKTTRHFFEPRLPDTAIPLAQLKGA